MIMSDKVEKQDWLNAEKQFEGLLVNSKLSAEVQEVVLSHIRKKLLEYPDADPMPEGVKDIVKDL